MEQLMTVATFDERDKADALRRRFDGIGIPAQVFDESMTQRIWWFTQPRAAMRVRVMKENAERAMALMREWDANAEDHILEGAVRCPECGSSRIEYPALSRKTLQTMFFALLNVLHVIPRQFFCEACHFTWASEPEVEPERDVLNWTIKRPKKEPNA